MADDWDPSRRRLLASGLIGSIGALSGCVSADTVERLAATGENDSTATETDAALPSVVDNGGDPEQTITVDVTVLDQNGDPAAGVEVKLEDRGGTPDDRYGATDERGRVRFIEGVGPPPCNRQTLLVPEHGLRTELSCNDGGAELEHTFRLGDASTPSESAGFPVVDNGSDDPEENLTVDVTVVDTSGDPIENATVELEDRGGTPDDRYGETGPNGRIRFVESVGPPPCNSQALLVPWYRRRVDLGCNDGGTHLRREITVERE